MASRIGLRLAASVLVGGIWHQDRRRSLRTQPGLQVLDFISREAAAAIGTVGGLAFIYSPSGNKTTEHHAAHATTPQKKAAKEASKEKEDEPAEQPEESKSKGDDNKSDSDASPSGFASSSAVQESVKQSLKFDGDPATAKAEEAKQAESSGGSKSDSDSDGDFVKISAEDTKEALKKADMDVPAIAKNEEEKQAKK
ncbi:hypothetical protein FRC12_003082 [Ceratobasidium sp. 428]|nr:hypothetical protein FRC12_003082 [Ceratobasidium sp. 428]